MKTILESTDELIEEFFNPVPIIAMITTMVSVLWARDKITGQHNLDILKKAFDENRPRAISSEEVKQNLGLVFNNKKDFVEKAIPKSVPVESVPTINQIDEMEQTIIANTNSQEIIQTAEFKADMIRDWLANENSQMILITGAIALAILELFILYNSRNYLREAFNSIFQKNRITSSR